MNRPIKRVAIYCGSASPENIAKIAHNHAVMGTFAKGKGRVFNAGVTDWSYGLDADPLLQQVTGNILRWLTTEDA